MSTFPWACTVYVDMHVYFDFPTNTILYLGIFSSIIFPPSSPFSLSLYSVAATCSPITFIGTGEHIDDFVLIYTIYTITLPRLWNSLPSIDPFNLPLSSVISHIKTYFWSHFIDNFNASDLCSFVLALSVSTLSPTLLILPLRLSHNCEAVPQHKR